MKWFKHYNDTTDGQSMQLLISEKDFETAFIYWFIIEQISKFENVSDPENRGRIILNFAFFKRKLGLNFQRTERVLQKIAKTFILEITINLDQTIEVFAPNWLKLQENRGGKRDSKDLQNFGKKRQDIRYKNIELEVEENKDTKKETTTTVSPLLNNSTANFNARFAPDLGEYKKILDDYDYLKNLERYIGQIKNHFAKPEDLATWFEVISRSKRVEEISKRSDDLNIKQYEIKKYVMVSLKKEIGVM